MRVAVTIATSDNRVYKDTTGDFADLTSAKLAFESALTRNNSTISLRDPAGVTILNRDHVVSIRVEEAE